MKKYYELDEIKIKEGELKEKWLVKMSESSGISKKEIYKNLINLTIKNTEYVICETCKEKFYKPKDVIGLVLCKNCT